MKKILVVAVISVVAVVLMGATLSFTGMGKLISTASGTYAASQKDTVNYTVEGIETSLRFYFQAGDSVSITNVIVRRLVGSTVFPVVAGDTLIGAVVSVTNDTLLSGAINTYQIRVTYAASGQGVTSPTSKYFIVKKYR
jgi:hypothetical protein